MPALPALTKAHSTRANIPCALNTTTRNVSNWFIWAIKAALMDQHANGTLSTSYARPAAATWTLTESCDGSGGAGSFGPTDKWGAVFDTTKLVRATSGTAHSWARFANAALGLEMVLDCNSATDSSFRIAFCLTSAGGFNNAGTALAAPWATNGWMMASSATDTVSTATTHLGDVTALGTHYFHFTCSADSFHFLTSRSGQALFSAYGGLSKTTGGPSTDQTYNIFALSSGGSPVGTGRGCPPTSALHAAQGCTGRGVLNTMVAQGLTQVTAGGAYLADVSSPADSQTSEAFFFPVSVWGSGTALARRGTIADVYECIGGGVGTSHPSVAAQTWVQTASLLIPFMDTAPMF